MSKCKHSNTELVCVTRRHIAVQEVKEDLWHDYIVGVKCRDCPEEMPMPAEIVITRHPYRGEPHYPAVGEKNEEKTEAEKKSEYERIINRDIDWFPGEGND